MTTDEYWNGYGAGRDSMKREIKEEANSRKRLKVRDGRCFMADGTKERCNHCDDETYNRVCLGCGHDNRKDS